MWGRSALLCRSPGEGFEDLLGLEAVDALVTGTVLRLPAFRLVQDGSPLEPGRYTRRMRLGGRPLDDFFHRAYYSHRMKMRKPDAEIFEQVLQDNNLNPAETLFLDDNASNVAGAAGVGIKTVFVNSPNLMLDYFNG